MHLRLCHSNFRCSLHSLPCLPIYWYVVLFWFRWTSYPMISFSAPMTSCVLTPIDVIWIFLGLMNHLVDTVFSLFATHSPCIARAQHQ